MCWFKFKSDTCVHISGAAYSGAEAEIQYLITRNGLPFLPTPMGKGVITDDHPLCVAAARSRLTCCPCKPLHCC